MTTTAEIQELELVVAGTNELSVKDAALLKITETLRPIAASIPLVVAFADECVVTNEAQANEASRRRDTIIAAHKLAIDSINDFDDGLIDRIFKLHRKWTAFRNRFSALEEAAKTIKRKVITWQEDEERKARAEQDRLQAEADAHARKERERLEKEAAKLKTPEKIQERLEAAAAVTAPVVTVSAPVAAVKVQRRWKVKSFDLTAMGIPAEVQGYITVETSKLERGKAANSLLTIKGVEFHQVTI